MSGKKKQINNPYQSPAPLYPPYKQYDEEPAGTGSVPLFQGIRFEQTPQPILPQMPVQQQFAPQNGVQYQYPKEKFGYLFGEPKSEVEEDLNDVVAEDDTEEAMVIESSPTTRNWDGWILMFLSMVISFVGNTILLNRIITQESDSTPLVVGIMSTVFVITPAIMAYLSPRMWRYIHRPGNTEKDIVLIAFWSVFGLFMTLLNMFGSYVFVDSLRVIDLLEQSLPWQVAIIVAVMLEVPVLRKLWKMGTK